MWDVLRERAFNERIFILVQWRPGVEEGVAAYKYRAVWVRCRMMSVQKANVMTICTLRFICWAVLGLMIFTASDASLIK